MRVRDIILAAGASLPLLLSPGMAFAQQDEGKPADVIRQALEGAKDIAGVFSSDGAGNAVHAQSGLVCPAYVQTAFLFQIVSFDSSLGKGTDVGCDYGRRVAPGSPDLTAKHTVFAVKAPEGMTLEAAFDQYRNEMHQSAPANAKSGGESLHFEDPPQGFPEFRSEELFYKAPSGRDLQTEVLVTIINGWIIEVRSTRASQYALRAREEALDQIVGTTLFFGAIKDLGGPDYAPDYDIAPSDPAPAPKVGEAPI